MEDLEQLQYRDEIRFSKLEEYRTQISRQLNDISSISQLPLDLRIIAMIIKLYDKNPNLRLHSDAIDKTLLQFSQENHHELIPTTRSFLTDSLLYHLLSFKSITNWAESLGDSTKLEIIQNFLTSIAPQTDDSHMARLLAIDFAIFNCCDIDLARSIINLSLDQYENLDDNLKGFVERFLTYKTESNFESEENPDQHKLALESLNSSNIKTVGSLVLVNDSLKFRYIDYLDDIIDINSKIDEKLFRDNRSKIIDEDELNVSEFFYKLATIFDDANEVNYFACPTELQSMWSLSMTDDSPNDDSKPFMSYDQAMSNAPISLSLFGFQSNDKSNELAMDSICKQFLEKLAENQSEGSLLIGMIEPLLSWVKMTLNQRNNPSHVRTAKRMQAQLDLIKTLVNNSCNESIMAVAFSHDFVPNKLLEKLLDAEYFDLAIELSTKFGLDSTPVWRTWAMQCLRNGYLGAAREKFHPCFTRAKYSSDQVKVANSKLLAKITSVISRLDDKKLPLMQQIKKIKQGILMSTDHSRGTTTMTLKPSLFAECLYYLDSYGNEQDRVQFYITYCLWDKSISYVFDQNVYTNRMQLYKIACKALIKNVSSNIIADFKLLMDHIRQDLVATRLKSKDSVSSGEKVNNRATPSLLQDKEIDSICDVVVSEFISLIREPDYQMEIAKLLSSDEAKIDFYIKQGKLSNAQRLACQSNNIDYVIKVIDEATKLNQNHVKTVCQMWLAEQNAGGTSGIVSSSFKR